MLSRGVTWVGCPKGLDSIVYTFGKAADGPNQVLCASEMKHDPPTGDLNQLMRDELQPFCEGGLVDSLLRAVQDRSQIAVQRHDF